MSFYRYRRSTGRLCTEKKLEQEIISTQGIALKKVDKEEFLNEVLALTEVQKISYVMNNLYFICPMMPFEVDKFHM